MSFISDFAQIDRKFAWSFLGFVLAALFGSIAIYTEFFRDTSPVLKYEIISNTKILDVKEDVSGLSIVYNNEDIRKAKKTLSIVTVKISNDGRSAILKNYYDTASPLGLRIDSGELIKAEIIDASTSYLQSNTIAKQKSVTTVEFSDVIIEPTEFYLVKLLILNPENVPVTVNPTGKVANVKKIYLLNQHSEKVQDSFLLRVTRGSIWVQLARVPIYFVGFFVVIISIFGPIALVSDRIEKRKRRKLLKQFKDYSKSRYDGLNSKIYEHYQDHGIDLLVKLRKAVSDGDKLQSIVEDYQKDLVNENGAEENEEFIGIAVGTPPHERRRLSRPGFTLKYLQRYELVTKSEDHFTRNEENISAMNEFIDFVTIKGS